jgi:hypothetical protein
MSWQWFVPQIPASCVVQTYAFYSTSIVYPSARAEGTHCLHLCHYQRQPYMCKCASIMVYFPIVSSGKEWDIRSVNFVQILFTNTENSVQRYVHAFVSRKHVEILLEYVEKQCYSKCYCVASVTKTFTLKAYKLSIVHGVVWALEHCSSTCHNSKRKSIACETCVAALYTRISSFNAALFAIAPYLK